MISLDTFTNLLLEFKTLSQTRLSNLEPQESNYISNDELPVYYSDKIEKLDENLQNSLNIVQRDYEIWHSIAETAEQREISRQLYERVADELRTNTERMKLNAEQRGREEYLKFKSEQERENREKGEYDLSELTPDVILELYNDYNKDRKKTLKLLMHNFLTSINPYNVYLSRDYSFLDKCTSSCKIKDVIIQIIEKDSTVYLSDFSSINDLTFHELFEIQKLLVEAPFPLESNFREEGYKYDGIQQIIKMFNESSYRSIIGNKKLANFVISGNEKFKGDVKFVFTDTESNCQEYFLHSYILEEYQWFNIAMEKFAFFGSFSVEVQKLSTVQHIIQYLYTGRFDYENCNEETLRDIYSVSEYFMLETLSKISSILINKRALDTFKEEENEDSNQGKSDEEDIY